MLLRAARVLGAKGWKSFRHVVLPAALPTYVAGLKQGWAFAWRSLLAGELLVQIAGKTSLGRELDIARQFADYPVLYATMIVILIIGIAVDARLRLRRAPDPPPLRARGRRQRADAGGRADGVPYRAPDSCRYLRHGASRLGA